MKKTNRYLIALSLITASFASAVNYYPLAIRERPLTLPQGIAELNAGIRYSIPQAFLLGANAAVGLTDELELGVNYGGHPYGMGGIRLAPAPVAFAGGITPYLGFGFLYDDPVSIAARIGLPIAFYSPYVSNVMVDVPVRFYLGDYVDLNLFHMNFVNFQFGTRFNVAFNLPVTFGFQFTDALWGYLGTNLAHFNTDGVLGQSYVWNGFPLHAGLLYAFHECFDAGIMFDTGALSTVAQSMNVGLGINFRFGNI